MSMKLEKLKEVNSQLNDILKNLETYIFIENIKDVHEKKIVAEQPESVMPIKQ